MSYNAACSHDIKHGSLRNIPICRKCQLFPQLCSCSWCICPSVLIWKDIHRLINNFVVKNSYPQNRTEQTGIIALEIKRWNHYHLQITNFLEYIKLVHLYDIPYHILEIYDWLRSSTCNASLVGYLGLLSLSTRLFRLYACPFETLMN